MGLVKGGRDTGRKGGRKEGGKEGRKEHAVLVGCINAVLGAGRWAAGGAWCCRGLFFPLVFPQTVRGYIYTANSIREENKVPSCIS